MLDAMEPDHIPQAAAAHSALALVTGIGGLYDRFIAALEGRRYADARAVRAEIDAGRGGLHSIRGQLDEGDVATTLSFLAQLEHLLDVLDEALLAVPEAERERRLDILHRSIAGRQSS